MKKLLLREGATEHFRCHVLVQSSEKDFSVHFFVKGSHWNTNDTFSEDPRCNWGLWESDVVEAFIQPRSHPGDVLAPYWEVQLSPLGQPFVLFVVKPRQQFYTPLRYPFRFHSEWGAKYWHATIKYPQSPHMRAELYGNFSSCLGKASHREYFTLHKVRERPLDFHCPELFQPIGS